MKTENVEVRSKNEELKVGAGREASGIGSDTEGGNGTGTGREGPSGLAPGSGPDAEGMERGIATAEEVLGKRTRRPRSDTAVRRLTSEQRAKVDAWLFDELLSYEEVATRCREELGVTIAANSIGGYCRQEQGVRSRRKADAGVGYTALLEGMNQAALRAVERLELGNDPKVLAEYARVLVAARQEANHSLRASTTREKFEFDAATACLVHQVRVQSIVEDEALDDGQRIMKIREELFGPDLPE